VTFDPASLDALLAPGLSYPTPDDPALRLEQEVHYSYWPVAYVFGDPTVISNVSLPLSGVQFSEVVRGVGELRAQLQLADDEVRAIYPWDKIIPRKTGIVVVREVYEPITASWMAEAVQHYVVWSANRSPTTGRMSIYATTVEGLWSRRLITKGVTWTNQDQTLIAADLLDPSVWSQIPLGGGQWPGWITIDPPTAPTGVVRSFTYEDGQETNLLEAHQNRSMLQTNSYEWTTRPRVLSGADAASANTFRLEYQMGFPMLGRRIGGITPPPRFSFNRTGVGNVSEFQFDYDGSDVPNIVWARGQGYDSLQVKALIQNIDDGGLPEWAYGFLQTEARFSDPDVKSVSTLTSYGRRYMWERLGSEQHIQSMSVVGNMPPYFGTYSLGDDVIVTTNDPTWPDDRYDSGGFVELALRIFGWVVTPPQGNDGETVQLLLSGGEIA
jgi:hypothetical protein